VGKGLTILNPIFQAIYRHRGQDSKSPQSLLWIHQEEWQKQILAKYGNTIALIDATYKTKYDVPLFLLSVRTNWGIAQQQSSIQSESAQNIAEAFHLQKSNPSCNPPYSVKQRSGFSRGQGLPM